MYGGVREVTALKKIASKTDRLYPLNFHPKIKQNCIILDFDVVESRSKLPHTLITYHDKFRKYFKRNTFNDLNSLDYSVLGNLKSNILNHLILRFENVNFLAYHRPELISETESSSSFTTTWPEKFDQIFSWKNFKNSLPKNFKINEIYGYLRQKTVSDKAQQPFTLTSFPSVQAFEETRHERNLVSSLDPNIWLEIESDISTQLFFTISEAFIDDQYSSIQDDCKRINFLAEPASFLSSSEFLQIEKLGYEKFKGRLDGFKLIGSVTTLQSPSRDRWHWIYSSGTKVQDILDENLSENQFWANSESGINPNENFLAVNWFERSGNSPRLAAYDIKSSDKNSRVICEIRLPNLKKKSKPSYDSPEFMQLQNFLTNNFWLQVPKLDQTYLFYRIVSAWNAQAQAKCFEEDPLATLGQVLETSPIAQNVEYQYLAKNVIQ